MPDVREANRNALAHFRNLLEHRTDANGKPAKGYTNNVALLRTEIARLENALAEPATADA